MENKKNIPKNKGNKQFGIQIKQDEGSTSRILQQNIEKPNLNHNFSVEIMEGTILEQKVKVSSPRAIKIILVIVSLTIVLGLTIGIVIWAFNSLSDESNFYNDTFEQNQQESKQTSFDSNNSTDTVYGNSTIPNTSNTTFNNNTSTIPNENNGNTSSNTNNNTTNSNVNNTTNSNINNNTTNSNVNNTSNKTIPEKIEKNIDFDQTQFQNYTFITSTEELKQRVNKIEIIGHRGGYEPSNSIKSFQKAVDFGLQTLEIDVELSQDLIPMVIHTEYPSSMDPFVENKGTYIYEYTAQQLKELNLTENGEQIPFLNETLQFCKDNNLNVILDLKGNNNLVVNASLDLVFEYGMENQTEIFSFKQNQLDLAKSILQEKNVTSIPLTRLLILRYLSSSLAGSLIEGNITSVGIVCSEYSKEFLDDIKVQYPDLQINCWYYRYDIDRYNIKEESLEAYFKTLDRPVDRVIVDFPPAMKQIMEAVLEIN